MSIDNGSEIFSFDKNINNKSIKKILLNDKQTTNVDKEKKEPVLSFEEVVDDKSTDQYTDIRILKGTHSEIIDPFTQPCFLSSAARSGCDSVILLEIKDDFTAKGIVTHWTPDGDERDCHIKSIAQLNNEMPKGRRFATIVSATIKDTEEAEQSDLFKVVTEWNGGTKPDLIYIPIDDYKVEKFSGILYQSKLSAGKIDDNNYGYIISVPGTEYSKTITPSMIDEMANKPTTFIKGEVK